jgi:hypothetical protein
LPSFGAAGAAQRSHRHAGKGQGQGGEGAKPCPGKQRANENCAPRQLHELLNPPADLLDHPHPMISLAPRQAQSWPSWATNLAPPRPRRTRDNGPFGLGLGRTRASPGGLVGRDAMGNPQSWAGPNPCPAAGDPLCHSFARSGEGTRPAMARSGGSRHGNGFSFPSWGGGTEYM